MTAIALGTFASEGTYLRARIRITGREHRLLGEWLPCAAESLGDGAGQSRIRAVTAIAGLVGGGGLFALTAWNAVSAYPLNVGGRPLWSWPAFLPAAVEFGALVAAIGGIVLLFLNAGLTRLHHPAFDLDEVARASLDAFVLAFGCDAGEEANEVLALMAEAGATHTRLITA